MCGRSAQRHLQRAARLYLFTTGGAGFITQDEEGSGVIDATGLLGAGWWLTSDQIHLAVGGELVEGGQYTAIYDPGTL